MEYMQLQRSPNKRFGGIAVVIVFHAVLIYALINGLARKVVEVAKAPLETRIIQELKPPPPEEPPPPPPKLVQPPPDFIPPPEVNIAVEPPPKTAIAAVSSTRTPAPSTPVVATTNRKAPSVRAHSCREPEYPSASLRAGEAGRVVLELLVGTDGKVVQAKVETSSGFSRLDQAAISALSLCRFEPGSVDGKPEQAWGKLAYVFKNMNR